MNRPSSAPGARDGDPNAGFSPVSRSPRARIRLGKLPVLFGLCVVAAACGPPAPTVLGGATMGTRWSVKLALTLPRAEARALQATLAARLERLEAQFSTWDPDSEISRFNRTAGEDWVPVPAEVAALAARAQRIAAQTGGAFDVTVGALVDLWGFGPAGPRADAPDAEAIEAARACVGYRLLAVREDPPALRRRTPCLRLDFSAIAKGHAVDLLADALAQAGHAHWLVEIGGEVRAAGRRADGQPWRVGVERPGEEAGVSVVDRTLALGDRAVASSGVYRNFFTTAAGSHAHLLDPRTGEPSGTTFGAASVVHVRAADADAYATALMVLDPRAAVAFAERHALAALMFDRVVDTWVPIASSAFRAIEAGSERD